MHRRTRARHALAALLLSASVLGLAACRPGNAGTAAATTVSLDARLSAPRAGDLWATEISYFSAGEFGDSQGTEDTAFGLLKVIEVNGEDIVLNTETGAWPKKQGAINDLRGDLANIDWDASEKIVVKRSELEGLVASGRILETRRLGAN